MQMKRFWFALPVLALPLVSLVSCGTSSVLTPPKGPGTAYPCGYTGVSCLDYDYTHTCCREYYSCVPNGCEYQGHDPENDFGASNPHLPRFPEGD